MKVVCPKCNKEAPWVENKEKYGKNYGKSYMCYFCKPCGTYVGCHNNTKKPLGTMTDKYGMDLRQEAHHYFDQIWKSGKMNRRQAYQYLKGAFGRQIHIGESDPSTCELIIQISKELYENNKNK